AVQRRADLDDTVALDRDVGAHAGRARPVDHCSTADHQSLHATVLLLQQDSAASCTLALPSAVASADPTTQGTAAALPISSTSSGICAPPPRRSTSTILVPVTCSSWLSTPAVAAAIDSKMQRTIPPRSSASSSAICAITLGTLAVAKRC